MAVPGQWPGPRLSVLRVTPSHSARSTPILGIWMVPSSIPGSEPLGSGGAAGWGSVAAVVVVAIVAGTVVVVDGSSVTGRVTATVVDGAADEATVAPVSAVSVGAATLVSALIPHAASPSSPTSAPVATIARAGPSWRMTQQPRRWVTCSGVRGRARVGRCDARWSRPTDGGERGTRRGPALRDAGRQAEAAVGRAGQRQPRRVARDRRHQRVDPLHVARRVLRHRAPPAGDAGRRRLASEADVAVEVG